MKQKAYYQALVKLISGYALLTGIIAAIFFFFLIPHPAKQDLSSTPKSNPYPSASSGQAPSPTGTFCGGIAGIQCPTGYLCKLSGDYPDASGTCYKKNQ